MDELAEVIADLVRAGTDPLLIGRLAAAIANLRQDTSEVQAAASRSKAAERTARWRAKRNGDVTSVTVTSRVTECDVKKESFPQTPFKEKTNTTSRARAKTDLPDDWEPDAKTWRIADELGFTGQEAWDQLERMRDWAKNADGGKGRKSDWNAAFRNWLKRTADDRKSKPQANLQRNSTAAALSAIDAVADEAIRRAGGYGAEGGEENPFELPGLRKSAA